MVSLFLSKGADLHSQNNEGLTPLDFGGDQILRRLDMLNGTSY